MTTFTTTIDSPVGPLVLTSDGTALTGVLFDAEVDPTWSTEPCAVLDQAAAQLGEYFAGERTEFDLPLEPAGTPFQRSTWLALREIPYAETINYGQLATAGREPEGVPRGRPGQRAQPDLDRGALPPGDRRRRIAHRVRRRAGPQAAAARPGATAVAGRRGPAADPALDGSCRTLSGPWLWA